MTWCLTKVINSSNQKNLVKARFWFKILLTYIIYLIKQQQETRNFSSNKHSVDELTILIGQVLIHFP